MAFSVFSSGLASPSEAYSVDLDLPPLLWEKVRGPHTGGGGSTEPQGSADVGREEGPRAGVALGVNWEEVDRALWLAAGGMGRWGGRALWTQSITTFPSQRPPASTRLRGEVLSASSLGFRLFSVF